MTKAEKRPPRRSKILVLSLHYKPEPNFITADVAEAWAAKGSKVTVITVHPNYPTGKFYPGTNPWRITRTVLNGVTIWRLPYYTDHSLSPVRRALSYVSYAVVAGILAPLIGGRPDTVWAYHGPFMTALPALFFKWIYGSRLIYTCADLWPESFVASNLSLPRPAMRLLYAYSRWINKQADILLCSTRGTAERYEKDGVSADKLQYVPVWVEGISDIQLTESAGTSGIPNIVYAGNLGAAQPVECLVRAASILQKAGVEVIVDIFGSGNRERELREIVERDGVANVHFHGRVSPQRAFEASARATAQVVFLRPSPLFRMSVPSKLSFCFAAGTPLLYGLEGESARIAAETGGAIPFVAEDPASLVAAIRKLLATPPPEREAMRGRLRSYYENNFAREALLDQYVRLVPP
ncbi:MAG: glycosyltransferase family 4 protein [Gemmatimonadaceae bacterium]|nr:glycosyltransferase family 4 protein [Gemmatimonadaceae bacterium]